MPRLTQFFASLRSLLGIEQYGTSHTEKLISVIGVALGILAVYEISEWYLSAEGTLLMVASMGATAILLFGVPHGGLSQPWPVFGGHLVAAAIGVTCHILFPVEWWTPALAASLAMGAMYYLHCIHPPGGATAMVAVIGGERVYVLGYEYLLTPVLMNVVSILLVALLFNNLFPWRRYPASLARRTREGRAGSTPMSAQYPLTQEDFSAALQQMESYVDITPDDMVELVELANQHAATNIKRPVGIQAGRCYSNGQLGKHWSVRQVIHINTQVPPTSQYRLTYKILAGNGRGESQSCPYECFRQWVQYEVAEQQGCWVKVDAGA